MKKATKNVQNRKRYFTIWQCFRRFSNIFKFFKYGLSEVYYWFDGNVLQHWNVQFFQ